MTVRHRYATWSKLVVSSAVALAVVVGPGLPGTHAEPVQIAFQVLDGPGVGFNDPLLGPQRLQAFAFAAARWGSFFVSAFPGETVPVGIRFGPLGETFGPDVLMDPDRAFGEVIHGLSSLERGMYEDLFWSLTPVQAVSEPASLWLVGAGLVGLLGYGWRRRLWQGLLGRPASESGTSCRVDGPRD